jgi:predicted HTH transcriptional regulator
MSEARKGISKGPHSLETRAKISAKQIKKPIIKYDTQSMEELKTYRSIISVKEDGYNPHAIQKVLKGKGKTSSGFGWKYAN